jgi:hypothetical protein
MAPEERVGQGDGESSPSRDVLPNRAEAFHSALLTEHFVLQSARGITVSEASGRASLYLATLSSSLIAFGFLAGTRYADAYLAVIIPVVVLLGLFTYERLVQTSLEDVVALAAIQRIRRYYRALVPDGDAYFPVPAREDPQNELLPMGGRSSWRGVFFTSSAAIGLVNAIVLGAGVALLLHELGAPVPVTAAIGVVVAAALAVWLGVTQWRRYTAVLSSLADP